MCWKVVTMNDKNMILKEVVDGIFSRHESEAKELERREAEREEIEKKCPEYYEAHMKSGTERLNNWVDWYKVKLDEIGEAPVDSRLRMLKLYRISEVNKNCGVTITSAGVINPINYPKYPPELKIPEHKSLNCACPDPCGIHEESPFCDVPLKPSPSGSKTYDQVDYFKKVIRSYRGRDDNADKYVKKVKPLIDCSQLDDLKLEEVRIAMTKVKCPRKLDISVFYKLTRRLPHEDQNDDDERLLFHFYNTFCNESIKLFHKMIKCRTNVLYYLLNRAGKAPRADNFRFMKGPAHQRTEEEIEFVFGHLGWNYSPIKLV